MRVNNSVCPDHTPAAATVLSQQAHSEWESAWDNEPASRKGQDRNLAPGERQDAEQPKPVASCFDIRSRHQSRGLWDHLQPAPPSPSQLKSPQRKWFDNEDQCNLSFEIYCMRGIGNEDISLSLLNSYWRILSCNSSTLYNGLMRAPNGVPLILLLLQLRRSRELNWILQHTKREEVANVPSQDVLIPLARGAAWLSITDESAMLAQRATDSHQLHGYVVTRKSMLRDSLDPQVTGLGRVAGLAGTFEHGLPHGDVSFFFEKRWAPARTCWDRGINLSAVVKSGWGEESADYEGTIAFDGVSLFAVKGIMRKGNSTLSTDDWCDPRIAGISEDASGTTYRDEFTWVDDMPVPTNRFSAV